MICGSNARARALTKRLLLGALFLILASCGGGGSTSGCASCGVTPLPGGFPKPSTIPNAAAVRFTRPGLDFLQENLATLAVKALGTSAVAGVLSFPIPPGTSNPKLCSVSAPTPSQCNAEIGLSASRLRVNAVLPNRLKIDGLLPVRIRDLPASYQLGLTAKFFVVAGDRTQAPGQNLCAQRGSSALAFKNFSLNVELPLVTETRVPRDGYTKVDVDNAVIDIGITQDDLEVCDDTCGGASFCQGIFNTVKSFAFDSLVNGVKGQIKTALTSAFCTAPTSSVTPACPLGSEPDSADLTKATKCLFRGTQECVPSLLGTDGRIDLSRALAAFSPGTQGGLDFVLASAGDMSPAPGDPSLPGWIPRSPPVPAQDNNANGVSLHLLGGALPQPSSRCVDPVPNTPPQDIPIPAELLGDTVTPWPPGQKGPHLGVALAGRFLGHAATSAYNSGLLCLGIATEQIPQLTTGYLSIIAPSIKQLAFEENPAAAAIVTRPGAPPTIALGNGTDLEKDPLLTITLPKLAVDLYVFSLDRYVRFLTYTADVTIPVNVQTGKDPTTNPNGGLLPVLGNLRLANASVTNAELLLDDPDAVSGGVSGLLGGLVGQLLGGGFSPIDLQAALASFGVGLDIPAGGIRKLTRGSDDFIGVFANLTKSATAAREEADTRASIVEVIVDRAAMGLTAPRARFPQLLVHAEGLATKATEQTWWVDRGPHAAWTTARDLVVDGDAMLLQGRHVLHVASRIVGDMASEDGTPVALPFTLDTLPPLVDARRDGRAVVVRARDYVSAEGALMARRRVGADGAWTPFQPLADLARFSALPTSEVLIEVRDEEGNVGRASLPALGDATDDALAASGSGCRAGGARPGTTGGREPLGGIGLGALALASTAIGRRARRRRS